jgi:transcriptional regulator with XRE-family HTH domain
MTDWETYRAALGANIRAERSRRGMSQEALDARMRELGFDGWTGAVGKIERGRGERRVTVEEILGLCMAIGVDLPTLMGAAGCAPVWATISGRKSA